MWSRQAAGGELWLCIGEPLVELSLISVLMMINNEENYDDNHENNNNDDDHDVNLFVSTVPVLLVPVLSSM